MLCSLATRVGEKELAEIRTLEQNLGMTLLAFSCHDTEAAPATEEQIGRIRALEDKLGVALVAVEQRPAA
jgi:hypothetical protein